VVEEIEYVSSQLDNARAVMPGQHNRPGKRKVGIPKTG
jgi:hypothetical protein